MARNGGEYLGQGIEGDANGAELQSLDGDVEERVDGFERPPAGEPVARDLGGGRAGSRQTPGGLAVYDEAFVGRDLIREGSAHELVPESVVVTGDDEDAGLERTVEEGKGARLVAGGDGHDGVRVDLVIDEGEAAKGDDLALRQVHEPVRDRLPSVGEESFSARVGAASQLERRKRVAAREQRDVMSGLTAEG
jgi:hypothetical protein